MFKKLGFLTDKTVASDKDLLLEKYGARIANVRQLMSIYQNETHIDILQSVFRLINKKFDKSLYNELMPPAKSIGEKDALLLYDTVENVFSDDSSYYNSGELEQSRTDRLLAYVSVMAERCYDVTPYDEQLMAVWELLEGRINEQKTGEGKTLVAAITAVLAALKGSYVHVITTNDYLALRDGNMAEKLAAQFLIPVGIVRQNTEQSVKQTQYSYPIVYAMHSTIGFDYLRDHLVMNSSDKVMKKPFDMVIVDEADNVLIDDARTPLIISESSDLTHESIDKLCRVDEIVKNLSLTDVVVDKKHSSVSLLEETIYKVSSYLGLENGVTIYSPGYEDYRHFVEQSLLAHFTKELNVDYIVAEPTYSETGDEIEPKSIQIIDESTGRILYGRRYGNGLHTAIEVKHGLTPKPETKTVAEITYQELFNLYPLLSGMTGTAHPEDDEFYDVYGLSITSIPTHKPVIRTDLSDKLFKTKNDKFAAVVKDTLAYHSVGRPVLIGTTSVEDSVYLSQLFTELNVEHNVLNAVNHAHEAIIIANAGKINAITIATNMAGRGTDIKISDAVKELGGLVVIGTNHNRSERIDNQLRGRSGRQGDPGLSQFYTSLEDDVIYSFGSDISKSMIGKYIDKHGGFVELNQSKFSHKSIIKDIRQMQEQAEGFDSDSRKSTFRFSNILARHRKTVYDLRDAVHDETYVQVLDNVKYLLSKSNQFDLFVNRLIDHRHQYRDFTALRLDIEKTFPLFSEHHVSNLVDLLKDLNYGSIVRPNENEFNQIKLSVLDVIYTYILSEFNKVVTVVDDKMQEDIFKSVILKTLDYDYSSFIERTKFIRHQSSLGVYAGSDIFATFLKNTTTAFEDMLGVLPINILSHLLMVSIDDKREESHVVSNTSRQEELLDNLFSNLSYTGDFSDIEFVNKMDLIDSMIAQPVLQPIHQSRAERRKKGVRQSQLQNGDVKTFMDALAELHQSSQKSVNKTGNRLSDKKLAKARKKRGK